ncbi:MAG: hypothetical protein PVJ27_03120 [Candidatus Brocadiaceae bacterium]|jgi:hypothetical protein
MESAEVQEEDLYRELQQRADRISSLILSSDYPAIDVVIQIRNLREFAERHFPHARDLFRMVYESRFRRLWEQFRADEEEQLPDW